jgi:trehalose synthase
MRGNLREVPTGQKTIDSYQALLSKDELNLIQKLAKSLAGLKILHLSSTAFGGGVAELLYTLIPLLNDLGLEAKWLVISGSEDFFTVTKLIHNGLQGMEIPFSGKMLDIYLSRNRYNADLLPTDFDFVFVHDPQPAPVLFYLKQYRQKKGIWIWRCHIDLTTANQEVWSLLKPFIEEYDAAIFTTKEFIPADLTLPKTAIIPPTIDPLSPKNMPLDEATIKSILKRYSVSPNRPIISQVSRFDPWKDPLGVIEAYRITKSQFKEAQLLMIASMATDDPEAWHYYKKTASYAGSDPDIHLLSNMEGVGNIEVNAFQRASTVIVQKSLREGFGLTVSEALWKEKPVVGGNVGGIRLQIKDGVNGFLVNSVAECGYRIIELLRNASLREKMGKRGKNIVREFFLTPRELRDYLTLLTELSTR